MKTRASPVSIALLRLCLRPNLVLNPPLTWHDLEKRFPEDKVAIHRLRKRYRDLFRQEIAETVADPADVESELRFLAAALTRQ